MIRDLRCTILNTKLTAATASEAVAFLGEGIKEGLKGQYICNVSVNTVMYARKKEAYREILNHSAMTLPNSRQLSVEMNTQGYPNAARIDIVDFMEKSFAMAEERGLTQFLYGSTQENLEQLKKHLLMKYPKLRIVGSYAPPFHAMEEDEDQEVTKMIQKSAADMIWVGLGMPFQEEWVASHAKCFDGVTIAVGYGLDVCAGVLKQAPKWMRKCSLDWIYRMMLDPKRLMKRYLALNLRYIWLTGKKTVRNTIAWIPALIMILVIFVLSSQTGVASKESSQYLTLQLVNSVKSGVDYTAIAQAEALEALDTLVRMLAHMAEYALLSLFIGLAVTVNGVRKKLRLFYMSLLGVLVALADEFFQIFIPGRYGDLLDALFDSFGVIATAILFYIIGRNVRAKIEIPKTKEPRRRKFMNLCLDDISFEDAVERIGDLAKSEGKHYVVTPNVDHVIKIENDIEFRRLYEDADLILTDGTPLMWIADSLGYPIKEKIPGADMLPRVCEMAAKKGYTMFFLGAGEGIAQTAAKRLMKRYQGLKVIGCYSPPLGFEKDSKMVEKAIKEINQKSADILVLALGSPKQEKFLYQHKNEMNFHVALPFGAAVDFEAGEVKRAPGWIRAMGMEWFYRFLQEPGRLFRRYFIEDIMIFWLAWKYRNEIIRIGTEEDQI
ncbi:MAG TPA: VanZ family protein [Lachnospiraceae bacterium]|nr:VanZ family protein [Lachnospiraceae bacterium]